jgi:hypothetical protein
MNVYLFILYLFIHSPNLFVSSFWLLSNSLDNLADMLKLDHISLFEEAEKLGFGVIESRFIKEIGTTSSSIEQGVRVVRSIANASTGTGTPQFRE